MECVLIRKIACVIAGFMIVGTPQTSMATSFDLFADFNDTGIQPAPGNPFTYGTETALNVGFTLLPKFGNTNCTGGSCQSAGTVDNYYLGSQFLGPTVGVVATGGTLTFPSSPSEVVPNNVLVIEPGTSILTVTRFTAPTAGVFTINGSFTDLQHSLVDLSILINGVPEFTTSYSGSSAYQAAIPFSIIDSLTLGDMVDFVIDGMGQQDFDVVGLTGQITDASASLTGTPLPAALPLFATGLGAMGLFGWRRRRKNAAAVVAD
jgi:hypothetical protein